MKKTLAYSFMLLMAASSLLPGQEAQLNNDQKMVKISCEVQPLALTPKGQRGSRFEGCGFSNPRVPVKQHSRLNSSSLNWSGYAALTSLHHPKKHSVSYVKGKWTVPTIATGNEIPDAFSGTWVGIDGYSNDTVEQIGTESDSIGGVQVNYAWFEMYPSEAFLIGGFPVNPGDVIGGRVRYIGDGVFKLTLINFTQHVYTVIPKHYTKNKAAKRSSAEWIVEAPSSSSGLLPLANFGTITFIDCIARIDGKTDSIKSEHWKRDRITMVASPSGAIKAQPSVLTEDKNFSITWHAEVT